LAGRFGGRFNDGSGAVDKRLLFQAMLDDEAMRREVLDMVHPLVKYRLREFWRAHADAVLAAAEIPLLLEVGWNQGELVDLAVCVTAPEDQRHARMDIARTWGRETAAKIESWQWPQEKKVAACDMIVDNSGDLNDLERETEALLEQLAGEIEKRLQARLDSLKRFTDPDAE
jgi:23S rRNA pseudouridine1911/1915/1917 synthase